MSKPRTRHAAKQALGRDHGYLRRILVYARPYAAWLVLGLVLLILQVISVNAMPLLIKEAIDSFLRPEVTSELTTLERFEGLKSICLILAGLVGGMFLFRVSHAYLMTWVGQCVLRDLRLSVFEKVLSLPMRRFDQVRVGRLMTRATSDLDAMQELVRNGIIGMLANLLLLVGAMVFMWILEWRLALVTYTAFPVLAGLLVWVNVNSRRAQREARSATSALNSLTQETLSGLFTLRMLNQRGRIHAKLTEQSDTLRAARATVADWSTWHFPILDGTRSLANVLLILACGLFIPDQIGSLVAFLYYIRFFFRPLEELAEQSQQLQSGLASAERVFALLDEPEPLRDPPLPHALNDLRGDIQFDQVHFSYDGKNPVLHAVNFEILPGQSAAIVGATGAGKSTILSLLCRFYDVNSGAVRLDDVDVRNYSQRELRRHLGVVQQDPMLFSGTLADNLRLGRPDITRAEMIEAAKYVNAHAFIEKLPAGYDTDLGEGGNRLSTGQKQLIALARVLLQDPKVLLLLDEATASVDSETESLIQDALGKLMQNRTSIAIAHRLSTVMNADTILVMRHGRLIEQGTHAELLEQDGYYRTLVEVMRHGMAV
ncbi:MAG: ABC transporter ATP-binding protein [Verrucomicrobia bacterium]|nr:ABC transporter ATP-binding protein [Verrucomicrobiota bacterium]MCH8512343.1 ABC transporter ATP-binding protein/permease [Kiritimatiellia bacterium]